MYVPTGVYAACPPLLFANDFDDSSTHLHKAEEDGNTQCKNEEQNERRDHGWCVPKQRA